MIPTDNHLQRRVVLFGLLIIGVFVAGAVMAGTVAPTDGVGTEICQDRLGDEWTASGLAEHPDWDRYHVKCARSTGILTSEQKWVNIRPAAWPDDAGDPVPI